MAIIVVFLPSTTLPQEEISPPSDEFPDEGALSQPSSDGYFTFERPIGSTSICKINDSHGYDWADGRWVRTNFSKPTIIIKKTEHRTLEGERHSNLCQMMAMSEEDLLFDDGFAFLSRCYQVSEMGAETTWIEECYERYDSGELSFVACDDDQFRFVPDGLFVERPSIASMDVRQNTINDYKDSMVISHGVCAKM